MAVCLLDIPITSLILYNLLMGKSFEEIFEEELCERPGESDPEATDLSNGGIRVPLISQVRDELYAVAEEARLKEEQRLAEEERFSGRWQKEQDLREQVAQLILADARDFVSLMHKLGIEPEDRLRFIQLTTTSREGRRKRFPSKGRYGLEDHWEETRPSEPIWFLTRPRTNHDVPVEVPGVYGHLYTVTKYVTKYSEGLAIGTHGEFWGCTEEMPEEHVSRGGTDRLVRATCSGFSTIPNLPTIDVDVGAELQKSVQHFRSQVSNAVRSKMAERGLTWRDLPLS